MFCSLIKKDKHLLSLIGTGNIFNFPLPERSTEGPSQSAPRHPLKSSRWERSSTTHPAAANCISAAVLNDSSIIILPLFNYMCCFVITIVCHFIFFSMTCHLKVFRKKHNKNETNKQTKKPTQPEKKILRVFLTNLNGNSHKTQLTAGHLYAQYSLCPMRGLSSF